MGGLQAQQCHVFFFQKYLHLKILKHLRGKSFIPAGMIRLRNTLLFFFIIVFYFILVLHFPLSLLSVCRESVWGVSELGAGGGFVSPASEAWPSCDTGRQHQSQTGLLWSGEPATGPQ